MPVTFTNTGIMAPPPLYTGPGDVTGSAVAWWGLRAYNSAYATLLGAAIDVTDTATGLLGPVTVHVRADGTLNTSEFPAYACSISKFYDQAGTKHATQSTLANMPTLNKVFPYSAVFTTGSMLLSAPNITAALPFSMSAVAQRTTDTGGANAFIILNGNTGIGLGWAVVGVDVVTAYGLVSSNSISVATNYAINSVINATGKISVNGTTTTGAMGSAGAYANDPPAIWENNSQPTTSTFTEGGIWAGDQSGNFAAMDSNQRTFWGLP